MKDFRLTVAKFGLRIWRIPLRYAVILILPILAMAGWMLFSAFVDFSKYSSYTYGTPPISVDLIRLFLHDGVERERIKFRASLVDDESPLRFDLRMHLRERGIEFDESIANKRVRVPSIRISVDPEDLARLNEDLPGSGRTFVRAVVRAKGLVETGKVRYRGDTEPHWLYRQKSLRVKLKKGRSVFGVRDFSLINWYQAVPYIEAIAQRLAAETGVLAPRAFPVRLILNERYHGLYLFYDQVDETFLRRNGRMPGSIYRGDINYIKEEERFSMPIDPETGIGRLWDSAWYWEKDANRNAETGDDWTDILSLIEAVNELNPKDFIEFSQTYFDNFQFARFLAFCQFTGSPHHDFTHNHKLFFDPYRGRFEQVSWDDKGFYGNPDIEPTLNPLVNKWRLNPNFELLKQRQLWQFLNREFSTSRVLGYLVAYHEGTEKALRQDGNRDFVFLDGIFNKLSRPYTMERYQEELLEIVEKIIRREEMLRAYIGESRVQFSWQRTSAGWGAIDVAALGSVGSTTQFFEFEGNSSVIRLYRDKNMNAIFDEGDEQVGRAEKGTGTLRLAVNDLLLPGLRERSHSKTRSFFGRFWLDTSPISYRYFFAADGQVTGVRLAAENAVTGGNSEVAPSESVGAVGVSSKSVHPWALPIAPPVRLVRFGPGKVEFAESQVFDRSTVVRFEAGTTVILGPRVSLFFEGRVEANGSDGRPIRFEAEKPAHPWGVIAVLGTGAKGSVFEHCRFSDGSTAERNLMYFSGMVSVRNARNVVFDNCQFGRNHVGDDTLHFAYANGSVTDCDFTDSRSDAFDADISQVSIRSCRFSGSGNDGLDLMMSAAAVSDCEFQGNGDKGISVGEASVVSIKTSSFDDCDIGLEVKDQSKVSIADCSFRESRVPVNLYRKNLRYFFGGSLVLENVSGLDPEVDIVRDVESRFSFQKVGG